MHRPVILVVPIPRVGVCTVCDLRRRMRVVRDNPGGLHEDDPLPAPDTPWTYGDCPFCVRGLTVVDLPAYRDTLARDPR